MPQSPPLDERTREILRTNEPAYIRALDLYYWTYGRERPSSLTSAAELCGADPAYIETYLAACPAKLGIPTSKLEAHALWQQLRLYTQDRYPDGLPRPEPTPLDEGTLEVLRRDEPLFIRALELHYGGVGKGDWISYCGAARIFGGNPAFLIDYLGYCPAYIGVPDGEEDAREYWTNLRAYRLEKFPQGVPMPALPPLDRKTRHILTTYEAKFVSALELLYSRFGDPQGPTFKSAARRSGVSRRFLLQYLVRFNDLFSIPFDNTEAKEFLGNLQRHKGKRRSGSPHPLL